MALLHRYLRLNDQAETCVFTFVVTRSVVRDKDRDVTTKDFHYGFHRFSVAFSRQDKCVGLYLMWRNPSEGMQVTLDYSATVLNREHFSDNQTFGKRGVVFTKRAPVSGNRKFLSVSLLETGAFMDRDGEFQLELSLSNVRSVFEHRFKVSQNIFGGVSASGAAGTAPGVACGSGGGGRLIKFETAYFSFGTHDWSLALYPTGRTDSQIGTHDGVPDATDGSSSSGVTLYLNRHTGLNITVRVRFNLKLGGGDDDSCLESGVLDELSDSDGKSYGWPPRAKMSEFVSRGVLRLVVEMHSVNAVSLVELPVSPPNPLGTSLYDKDKLAWEMEPDLLGETLRLRLQHRDAKNIPRNHIRYVCWTAFVLKRHQKLKSRLGQDACGGDADYAAKLPMDQKSYFQYFVQDDTEVGTLMDTKIPIKEISDPNHGYLVSRSSVRVHVEWLHSCLLFQSTYHHYDDVTRVQTYQMRQDIQNLKLENDLLERRLASIDSSGAAGGGGAAWSSSSALTAGGADANGANRRGSAATRRRMADADGEEEQDALNFH